MTVPHVGGTAPGLGAPGLGAPGLGAPAAAAPVPVLGAPGGAGLLTPAATQDLQQNQILKDHKKRLTEYKIKLENELEEAQEDNTGITKELFTRIPLVNSLSTFYPNLTQQIADLQRKIASLTREITDIDAILALTTARKSEAVGVLVLQETCRDLEEKINAAEVKIGDREISIDAAATFTCTHILGGANGTKGLAVHHQEITQKYTERRNKLEAIQTLLR